MARASKVLRFGIAGLGLLALLPVVAHIGVNLLVSSRYLEEFLHENLNAEVEVGKVSVNLFAREVVAREVKLSPKEGANPASFASGIEVEKLRLGVKALPLFSRRLETTSLIISHPTIRVALSEEGDWSIAELFRRPDDDEESSSAEDDDEDDERGALEAESNGWLAKLRETRLEEGRLELLFEKNDLRLEISDLDIVVKDLQFDPEDLATLNQVQLDLKTRIQLRDEEQHLLMNLDLAGEVNGKLFDETSGDFDADVQVDLALGKGSYLDPRIQIVRQVWGYLEEVERIGISLGELPDRILFGRSGRIAGSYRQERMTLGEPLSLSVGKWELGLARDSWIAAESGQHQIGVEFLAGAQVSETLGGWLKALPKEAQSVVQERFVDERQVLWRVDSKGDLGDPELDYLSQLPEAKGLLEGVEESLEEEVDKVREKAGRFFNCLLYTSPSPRDRG